TIYASFADASLAEKAAGALLDFGLRAEDLSIVSSRTDDQEMDERFDDRELGRNTADEYKPKQDSTEHAAKSGISTTTPGDAASGASKGAGIGLGVGIAAALASIFIPGFGLVAGGGALATAIAGGAG